MTAGRKYQVWDVFTSQPLAGNPLAVVLDADGLDTEAMLRIANEFNLSETTFILPPADAKTSGECAHLHAILRDAVRRPSDRRQRDRNRGGRRHQRRDFRARGESRAGALRRLDGRSGTFAEFTLPKLPEAAPFDISREAAAAALGLDPQRYRFREPHGTAWSAGVPYVTIPVRNLAAAGKAKLNTAAWLELTGGLTEARAPAAYVYCRESTFHDSAFHARMFAGHVGLVEDPGDGLGGGGFCRCGRRTSTSPSTARMQFWIEQGMEMGRPSRIRLSLDIERGTLTDARIGGNAVMVAEGLIFA